MCAARVVNDPMAIGSKETSLIRNSLHSRQQHQAVVAVAAIAVVAVAVASVAVVTIVVQQLQQQLKEATPDADSTSRQVPQAAPPRP